VRDKARPPSTDVGGGWIIADFAEADKGCHTVEINAGPRSGEHYISFNCGDIEETDSELCNKEVEFNGEITAIGYGHAMHLIMHDDVKAELSRRLYKC
jgi:hypothetical protein